MILYLEVEGVLSAKRCYKAWPEVVLELDGLCWSPSMLGHLISLQDRIELVWVSRFGELCSLIAREMGMGKWGSEARILTPLSGEYTEPSIYWKAEAIWSDLGRGLGSRIDSWSWFDAGVGELRGIRDYADLVRGSGYVPEISKDIGITPENLITLELQIQV